MSIQPWELPLSVRTNVHVPDDPDEAITISGAAPMQLEVPGLRLETRIGVRTSCGRKGCGLPEPSVAGSLHVSRGSAEFAVSYRRKLTVGSAELKGAPTLVLGKVRITPSITQHWRGGARGPLNARVGLAWDASRHVEVGARVHFDNVSGDQRRSAKLLLKHVRKFGDVELSGVCTETSARACRVSLGVVFNW
jgi:hypothetical protein